jgi:hypothetical protein
MYSRKVAPSSVMPLYHPGNVLFQTMHVNSDVSLVPNILYPLALYRNCRSHLTGLRILRRVVN